MRVPDRFTDVSIENRSTKNLDINGIDVLFPTFTVTPVITPAPNRALKNDGVQILGDVEVEIQNTHATAGTNVYLDGAINNPTGLTTIVATKGSILDRASGATTRINTATLNLIAGKDAGKSGSVVQANIVQTSGLDPAPTLQAKAGGNVSIELTTSTQAVEVLGVEAASGDIALVFGGKPVVIGGPISVNDSQRITISNVASISDGNDFGPDIVGSKLAIGGSNGDVGAANNSLETHLKNVEIATTGDISISNDRILDHWWCRQSRRFECRSVQSM